MNFIQKQLKIDLVKTLQFSESLAENLIYFNFKQFLIEFFLSLRNS